MPIEHEVRWSGQRLTRQDVEELLAKGALDPDTTVHVSVEPRRDHPTDYGGTIRLHMEGRT